MKIFYGVVGEGMGHATRSKVILSHLAKRHELKIVASGRAHSYLKRQFPDLIEIEGFKLAFDDNAIDRKATFSNILRDIPDKASKNLRQFLEMCRYFSPDVVISDFESYAHWFGRTQDIPIISIDNMQILNRCTIDIDIPKKFATDFKLAKNIVKGKLPGCYHYMITSFFFPPVRKRDTSLYPPILRDDILQAKTEQGDHILVYQTSASHSTLVEVLKGIDAPFIVYGFGKNERIQNVVLKDFSEKGFVDDLASSKAVLANAGFSLMGEAVYLGKPYYAIPLRRQFEQILNGLYLQEKGFGEYHMELKKESIEGFLKRTNDYHENLKAHKQDGNVKILHKLDELLREI